MFSTFFMNILSSKKSLNHSIWLLFSFQMLIGLILIANLAAGKLSEEHQAIVNRIETFGKKLVKDYKNFLIDSALPIIKKLKNNPNHKKCLFDNKILATENGLISQIKQKTEEYLSMQFKNGEKVLMEPEKGISLLEEIVKLSKKLFLDQKEMKFLENEANSSEAAKLLYELRLNANKEINQLLKELWKPVHLEIFTNLSLKISAKQERIRNLFTSFLAQYKDGAQILKEVPQIAWKVLDKMEDQFKSFYRKQNGIKTIKEKFVGKFGKIWHRPKTSANDVSKPKTEVDNIPEPKIPAEDNSTPEKRQIWTTFSREDFDSYKQFLDDIMFITKHLSRKILPDDFIKHFDQFKAVFTKYEIPYDDPLIEMRDLAETFLETVYNGIEKALKDEEKIREYRRFRASILLNATSQKIIALMKTESGQLELNKEKLIKNLALLHETVKAFGHVHMELREISEPIKLVGKREKTRREKILHPTRKFYAEKSVDNAVVKRVKEFLVRDLEQDEDLYSYAMESKWLPGEKLYLKSKVDENEEVRVQVVLEALQMLEYYKDFKENYEEDNGLEKAANAFIDKNRTLLLDLDNSMYRKAQRDFVSDYPQRLGGYIFLEFVNLENEKKKRKKEKGKLTQKPESDIGLMSEKF